MNKVLTERQEEILSFLREYQMANGLPPSSRDIQRHFKFKSQTAAMCHLRALAKKGIIEQLAGRGVWGLKVSEVQMHLFELPVYGTIPAGLLAAQEQDPEETLPVNPALFGVKRPRPGELWALRVKGDSMVDAHILEGDIVILCRRDPQDGDIIAALVDDTGTTLKRLVYVRGKPVLRPENKRYRDIIPERRLESQGVVIGLVRRQQR